MYFSEIPKNLEVNIISEGVPSNWLGNINSKSWLYYHNLLDSASISNDGLELFRFNPVSKKDPNRNYKLKNIRYYHFNNLYKKDTPIKKISISNSGFKISMNLYRFTGRNYTSRAVIELTNPEIDSLNLGYRFWIDINFQELRDLLGMSSGILEKGCKFPGTYKIVIGKTGCYPEYSLVRESDFEYKEPSNISYSIKLGEALCDKERTRDLKAGNLYLLKNRMGAFICLGSAQNISLVNSKFRIDYGYSIDDFARKIRNGNKKLSHGKLILDDAIIVYNIPSVEMFCHIINTGKFLKDKQINLYDMLSIVTSSSHISNESLVELLECGRIYAIDVKEANSLFYDFGKIFNLKTSTISMLDQIKDFVKDQYLRVDNNAEELITTVCDIFPEFREFHEEKFYLGFISSKAAVYRQLVKFMQHGSPNLTSEQIYDAFKTIDSTDNILNHFAQKTLSSSGLYNYYLLDTNLLKQAILSSQPDIYLGRNLEKEDWIKIFNKCLND